MGNVDVFRIFAKVGDLGSISGAARALHLPKATVSRAVSRLEQRYGVVLVERTTRNVVLTEIGSRLHEHCARLTAGMAALDDEIAAYRGEPSGVLKVGCPSYVSTYIAPHLPGFLRKYPAIDLRMKVADRVLPNPDGFDVVLHVGWLADSTLVARKLRDVPMVLVASPDYLERSSPLHTLDDLAAHTVIGMFFYADAGNADGAELPARLPSVVISGPDGQHPLPVWRRFLSNDQGAIIEMAEQGVAVVPTAQVLVREQLLSGRLVQVLPDHVLGPMPSLYAIHSSRSSAPPKVKAFSDFIARIASTILEA